MWCRFRTTCKWLYKYIPHLEKTTLQSVVDGYFAMAKKAKFGLVTAPCFNDLKKDQVTQKSPNKHEKEWENIEDNS